MEAESDVTRWHNYYADGHAHFCTLTVKEWRPLLMAENVQVLYDVWQEARQVLGVRILAYVVMADHFHAMLWGEQGQSVARFLQRVSSLVSKKLQPGGGFWKERPRVLPVYSPRVFRTKVEYIHNNPITRGLAACADDWPHSSFRQIVMGRSDVPFQCDAWDSIGM